MAVVIGVRGWLLWTCLAAVLVMGLGSYCALRNPPPPEPCRETVEYINGAGCSAGCPHPDHSFEWVDPKETGQGAGFRCICRRRSAGAPDAAEKR